MRLRVKKRSEKSGMSPGVPVAVGEQKFSKPVINVVQYDQATLVEHNDVSLEAACQSRADGKITWINVDGVHDSALVESIGKAFSLHPLTIEDVLNTSIRPKQEDFESYLVIILKMIVPRKDACGRGSECFSTEQVSIILGKNWVITFQETNSGDAFDGVRARLRGNKGRHRNSGADYLAYSLVDAIVDGYFIVLEQLGEQIDSLEELVTSNLQTIPSITDIHNLRRFGLFLRRYVWPVRDVLSGLDRDRSALIQPATHLFLRDVYDHSIEIIEMIESYRDMSAGLMELHLSTTNNRTNSVMMVLTVVTTIFMPLTFIAGVYGMNFHHMPELDWDYGYPMALGLMGLIAVAMLIYFRRRNWV